VDTIGSTWLWLAFGATVLVMLAIDLFVVGGGRSHRVGVREALTWSLIWVAVSLAFAAGLWFYLDAHHGQEVATSTALDYLTGYVIEKSLAVDNVFVWLMLFSYFGIPLELQKRVLLYGVLGAILMRTVMIFAGAWLIAQFHWVLYLFGAFLLFTGIRMYWATEEPPDLENNPAIRWIRKHMKVTTTLEGERFFVMLNGARHATPLLLALVLVEISDLIFAVDSIPAIFAITTDPFVVLTSNIFAILGLRSMYFLLADAADRFSLLKYGLAMVLMFIGTKMILIDIYKVPTGFSLAVVAVILGSSIWLSLRRAPSR
jgi:tellurite resistance protein TerC